MQHTPGPWTYEAHAMGTVYTIQDKHNCHVTTIETLDSVADPHNKANAYLIAAAPELLAVAQGALGYLEALPPQYRPDEAWFVPLRQAVAEATGG